MKWSSYLVLAVILLVFALAQGGFLAQRFWFPKELESTDARLMAAVLDVGTPVSGIVRSVSVVEGQQVESGDILFVIVQQSPLQPHGGNLIVVSAHRSGIVINISGDVGKFVQASQVLAQIIDRTQAALYVEAELPIVLDDLGLIRTPHAAMIQARYLNGGQPIAAAITSIDPQYDMNRGTVEVRLHLLEEVQSSIPIVMGMPVSVSLDIENVNRLKETTLRIVHRLVPSSTAEELP